MAMKFLNVGFGSMVSIDRVVAIISPESSPAKRMIQEARETSRIVDATHGRKTKSIVVMDSMHLVLSSLQPETLGARGNAEAKAE